MATIDYLPFATGGGATVESQASFAGSAHQINGFSIGIADPGQANKVWRQVSVMAAAIANFVSQSLGNINILDDGNVVQLTTFFQGAVKQVCGGHVTVAFSPTAVFDCNLGTTFICTLTGNMTAPTIINVLPGVLYTFILVQDGVGGHVFTPPSSGALLFGFFVFTAPGISTNTWNSSNAAGQTLVQTFVAKDGSNLFSIKNNALIYG